MNISTCHSSYSLSKWMFPPATAAIPPTASISYECFHLSQLLFLQQHRYLMNVSTCHSSYSSNSIDILWMFPPATAPIPPTASISYECFHLPQLLFLQQHRYLMNVSTCHSSYSSNSIDILWMFPPATAPIPPTASISYECFHLPQLLFLQQHRYLMNVSTCHSSYSSNSIDILWMFPPATAPIPPTASISYECFHLPQLLFLQQHRYLMNVSTCHSSYSSNSIDILWMFPPATAPIPLTASISYECFHLPQLQLLQQHKVHMCFAMNT